VAHPTAAPHSRPRLIYWPAVALAAVPAALFAVGLTACVARLPARGAKPIEVARVTLPDATPDDPPAPPTPPAPPAADPAPPPAPPTPAPTPAADQPAEAPAAPAPSIFDASPVVDLTPAAPPKTCETFGTSVEFAASPAEAAKTAKRDDKLLFLMHISGNFEDDAFT
jgi:hypothetical protein